MLESIPAKQIEIINIERKAGELILELRNGIQCLTHDGLLLYEWRRYGPVSVWG